jgi:hypothetical protein
MSVRRSWMSVGWKRLLRGGLLGALVAAPAAATPEFGTQTLDVRTKVAINITGGAPPMEDVRTAPAALGDRNIVVESLLPIPGGERFYTRTTGPTEPFASAMVRGDGSYGVGASGLPGQGHLFEADAGISVTVTNTGPGSLRVSEEYRIEPIEVLVSHLEGTLAGTDFARVFAEQIFVHVFADGTRTVPQVLFDYGLTLHRNSSLPGGPLDLIFSEDLGAALQVQDAAGNFILGSEIVRDSNVLGEIDVFGVRIDAFDDRRFIGTLLPGESFEITFSAVATLLTAAEFGGQAQIGDPFSVPASGPTRTFIFTEVPEPSLVALLLVGALLLARAGRRA